MLVLKYIQNFYLNFISRYIDQDTGKKWLDMLSIYDVKKDKELSMHIILFKVINNKILDYG